MLEAINPDSRIEFTSQFDKSEPKTVFVMKPLSGAEIIKLATDGGGMDALSMLSQNIVEIKNFNPQKEVKEILNMLPSKVFTELFEKANKLNYGTEEDEKN